MERPIGKSSKTGVRKGVGVKTLLLVAAGMSAVVAAVLLGTHWLMYSHFESPHERGLYGDMFGVANAIFGGLSLIFIVTALLYQGREVNATLIELSETAKAHQQQALLASLSALLQATLAPGSEGRQETVEFEGKQVSLLELRKACLRRLVAEYEDTRRRGATRNGQA